MLLIYQLIISLILLISPLIIYYRIKKSKEDPKRFQEKFAIPSKKRLKGKLIWFHGASVGELLSIIPIIKNYEKNKNINQILITSSTLSSSKVLKKFKFKKTIHQFYPIDYFLFTNKFLKFWKPNLAVFIESEIWPYMFKQIQQLHIPLVLLNARLTKKSFYRWMKIKDFFSLILKNVTVAFPQNLETKIYLNKANVKKINHIGNLKFAENHKNDSNTISKNLKREFNKKKIWVASSTHRPEEFFCARAHIILKKANKNLITIIIPRHIHRVKEIVNQIKKLKLNVVLHSSKIKKLNDVDIYIVDTFGETRKFHEISSTVFLGGSIVERGGQNPLEAARFGANILHGPNIYNFKDVYKFLKKLNVSKKIKTPNELAFKIKFKKNMKTGVKIKNIGDKILKKTIYELNKQIRNEYEKT